MDNKNDTPIFPLIPFSEIDDDARKIAVAWVEQYGTMGFDIQNKHKLASDIMNYHRLKLEELEKWCGKQIKNSMSCNSMVLDAQISTLHQIKSKIKSLKI